MLLSRQTSNTVLRNISPFQSLRFACRPCALSQFTKHPSFKSESSSNSRCSLLNRASIKMPVPMLKNGLATSHGDGLLESSSSDVFLFTSESVGEGHPDKMCDQVRLLFLFNIELTPFGLHLF